MKRDYDVKIEGLRDAISNGKGLELLDALTETIREQLFILAFNGKDTIKVEIYSK